MAAKHVRLSILRPCRICGVRKEHRVEFMQNVDRFWLECRTCKNMVWFSWDGERHNATDDELPRRAPK